jgi:hypothetical protein
MTHAHPSVSDGSLQGQDAQRLDPKDNSAGPERQTPAPSHPLHTGGEIERIQLVADGARADEVYGSEWCFDPFQQFRRDLHAVLALTPPSPLPEGHQGAPPDVSAIISELVADQYSGELCEEVCDLMEQAIDEMIARGVLCVSDQSREAGKTKGLDPKDESAVPVGQTPQSPLPDRDIGELIADMKSHATAIAAGYPHAREVVALNLRAAAQALQALEQRAQDREACIEDLLKERGELWTRAEAAEQKVKGLEGERDRTADILRSKDVRIRSLCDDLKEKREALQSTHSHLDVRSEEVVHPV